MTSGTDPSARCLTGRVSGGQGKRRAGQQSACLFPV